MKNIPLSLSVLTPLAARAQVYMTRLLKMLRARSVIAGLEISDTSLRFAYFNGKNWDLRGVRIPPGIIAAGAVRDEDGFVRMLERLYEDIAGLRSRRKINVIVSLGSLNIYSQVITIPALEGSKLDEAAALNLQMSSPLDLNHAYYGWQVVHNDAVAGTVDVLGAFVEQERVEVIHRCLRRAGFLAVAVEPKALAITRLVNRWAVGFDPAQPSLLIVADSAGIDFLVMRHGTLYFEYFKSWHEIQGDARELSDTVLKEAVVRDLTQVLHFYAQHWHEPLQRVLISAAHLEDQIERIITGAFSLSVSRLRLLAAFSIPAQWFVALGSGLRGAVSRASDFELSLLGTDARQEFARQQVLAFIQFWALLLPLSFLPVFAAFVITYFSLANTERDMSAYIALKANNPQVQELGEFETRALAFNQSVAIMRNLQGSFFYASDFLTHLSGIAGRNAVTLRTVNVRDAGASIIGTAGSREDILRFKKAMEDDAVIDRVTLPLTEIRPSDQGLVFSLNFVVSPASSSGNIL